MLTYSVNMEHMKNAICLHLVAIALSDLRGFVDKNIERSLYWDCNDINLCSKMPLLDITQVLYTVLAR